MPVLQMSVLKFFSEDLEALKEMELLGGISDTPEFSGIQLNAN